MDNEKIIQILKDNEGRFISGEVISQEVGITRAAIWKRISTLKEMGYVVDARQNMGYRLMRSPDILTPSEIQYRLGTKIVGKDIRYYPVLESTNAEAFRLASAGAEDGTVVVTDHQSGGKGRLNRTWFSFRRQSISLSVILRPKIVPYLATMLTYMTGIALYEAIYAQTTIKPSIKWPNDILMRGKKVAGVLCELSTETDVVNFAIVGIGVNLNVRKNRFPEEIREVSTSLYEEKKKRIKRVPFVKELLRQLDYWYSVFLREGGDARILLEWKERAQIIGQDVRIRSFDEEISGKVLDVDSYGALIVESSSGEKKRVIAGDLETFVLDEESDAARG